MSTTPRTAEQVAHRSAYQRAWYIKNAALQRARTKAAYRAKVGRPLTYGRGRERASTLHATVKPSIGMLFWAAGFLEGEGSFSKAQASGMATAVQIECEPLERLLAMFGGSLCQQRRTNPRYDPIWVWTVSGSRARGIVQTLYQLMSTKRQRQIRAVLAAEMRLFE